jgi:hypothetical protein
LYAPYFNSDSSEKKSRLGRRAAEQRCGVGSTVSLQDACHFVVPIAVAHYRKGGVRVCARGESRTHSVRVERFEFFSKKLEGIPRRGTRTPCSKLAGVGGDVRGLCIG